MKKAIRLALVSILLPASILMAGCSEKKPPPRAVAGMLDFSDWDFKSDGPVKLTGEWEIYWRQLLTPDDFAGPSPPEKTGYSIVPKYWEGQIVNGIPLNYRGYATLRLKVQLPPGTPPLALEIFKISGASKIWLDGEFLGENGTMGTSAAEVREITPPTILHHLNGADQDHQVVIQLANFHMHPHFGTLFSIRLGRYENLRQTNYLLMGIDLLSIGGSFIMGLYHLILFLFRTKTRSNLYFGAMCFCFSLWMLYNGVSKGMPFYVLLPGVTWQMRFTGSYSVLLLTITFLALFIHSLFPRECAKAVISIAQVLCGFWILAAIAFPFSSTSPFLIAIFQILYHPQIRLTEILTTILVVYLVAVVIRAARRKRPGANFMVASFLVLSAAILHDVLMAYFSPASTVLSAGGMLAMLICQSTMLAGSFSRSFLEVEQLSETLQQKNIALSRLDKIKDGFLANTSHELRTPLNGIIGITESLLQGASGKLPEKARVHLSMIFASAKRLAGLVNDLLDFSRLKNRDITLTKKPLDIKALTDAVLSVARNLTGPKPLKLVNAIPGDIALVEADENRLQQILYNLVGNAIKFTEEGTVTVGARGKGDMVEVWVADTGIGIPEDRFDTIFQAFEQVESGATRSFEGTGLGLSITRRLVNLHGGDIRVASAVGKGSTFFFTLPANDTPPHLVKRPAITGTPQGDTGSGLIGVEFEQPEVSTGASVGTAPYQALIVDDDPVNLQVVANHLSVENISFNMAFDGIDALRRLESGHTPHVILLDIMMPKMSGYEVCQKIRETYPPSELPIIILTAKNHVAELVEGFKSGANDYLPKPFSKDELIARVKCQLDIKAAYQTVIENQRLEREVLEQTRKKELARLKEEKAMLEKLRYQVNPHFLFNALTSIRGAILKDGTTARNMVTALSAFFRLSLAGGKCDHLSVREEIELVRNYLTIEKVRMGGYLSLSIHVDPETEDALIPALCLQPVVENAVKYGKMTSPEKLEIRITVNGRKDRLFLTVMNSGNWVKPESGNKPDSLGIGIENVKTRLEKLYRQDHTFTRKIRGGWVTIGIELPLSMV